MRHRVRGKLLGRSVGQRNALRRTLITQLLTHEKITTTRAKADAIRGAAEQMITKVKRSLASGDNANQVHVRRLLIGRLDNPEVVRKLFTELAPRYAERPGGYTRLFRLGQRKGDGAEMVVLELVDRPVDTAAATGQANLATRAGGFLNRIRGRGNRPASEESGEAGSAS